MFHSNRWLQLVGVSGLTLLLAACGSKGANQAANDIADHAGNSDAARGIKQSQLVSADWGTRCSVADASVKGFGFPSETQTLDMGSSLEKTTTLFSDGTCGTGQVAIVEDGRYSLQDRVSNDVYQINEHYDSVQVTPLTVDAATALNSVRACGFTDWALGAKKDVTANTSSCLTKTPRDVYDIVQITGLEVRFGLATPTQDKSGMSQRPTTIDQSVTYSKQQ